MFKLDLERGEEPEIKLPKSTGSLKKKESSRKTSISALLTMPKPLTVWITTNWKILLEMGIPDHLTCLLRNLYAGLEATLRTGHGETDCFQFRKGVCQGCIFSWFQHKLESRLPGEISITWDMQMTPPYGRKQRWTKEPLDESDRGEWKRWLKAQQSEN